MRRSICFTFLVLCFAGTGKAQVRGMYGDDIHIFEKTKVWELARAVQHQRVDKIKELCEAHPKWINFQEWRFGKTVLNWAVKMRKLKSVEALLKEGANPNIQDSNGVSAFILASSIEEISEYLQLLLKYKGDVNAISNGSGGVYGQTPLIAAVGTSLNNTQILVDAGANINFNIENCEGALEQACLREKIEILRYLIIEKGANFKKAISYRKINGDSIYVTDELRSFKVEPGSEEFNIKMELIEYMRAGGMDYWSAPPTSSYYENVVNERNYLKSKQHR
jgi:hypothetical protein